MPTWISDTAPRILVFGLGYSGIAVARAAATEDCAVCGTVRGTLSSAQDGIERIAFADADRAIASATHLLCCAPPNTIGDPVLALYQTAIETAPHLRWVGYLSSIGVYGDRNGAWVDENSVPAPASDRSRRRMIAEAGWCRLASRYAIDVFRLAGIYGPQRSVFDDLRAGTARRITRPGHTFGRIHRDDIVRAVLAAMRQNPKPGVRILNLTDDEPAESADVMTEAARLLGIAPPACVPFAEAYATMSSMARSFWSENRKVSGQRTQRTLGLRWLYPSYREGLRAILAEESGECPA
jgi:nucleoside-diphosphate-sugar epimerase